MDHNQSRETQVFERRCEGCGSYPQKVSQPIPIFAFAFFSFLFPFDSLILFNMIADDLRYLIIFLFSAAGKILRRQLRDMAQAEAKEQFERDLAATSGGVKPKL